MQPHGSLPRSQDSVICSYTEPDQSILRCSVLFLKVYFNIILPSTQRSSKWSLSFNFQTKTLDILEGKPERTGEQNKRISCLCIHYFGRVRWGVLYCRTGWNGSEKRGGRIHR